MAEEEAARLAGQVLELVQDLEEEEETEDEGYEELRLRKRDVDRALSQGTAAQALQAAMAALESLILLTKYKEPQLVARIREVVWLAKDAGRVFEDLGDERGRAAALATLTRAHLMRAKEPDAPRAAVRAAKDAVAIWQALREEQREAGALCLTAEAHLAMCHGTPFEKVLLEHIRLATVATRRAEEIFRAADDRQGLAKALHITAKALLQHTDDDEVLEGERFVDEARELYQELGDKASEVAVLLTGIAARQASSGPDSALMLAKDAAEDFQQEGGRPKDTALASVLAAGFQLDLGEYDEALKLCSDAQALYDRAGSRRGVGSALELKAAVYVAKKQLGDALNTLEDLAALYLRLGDRKGQGRTLLSAASTLLAQLSTEVEEDTQSEFKKQEPTAGGISVDEVHRRSADGLEFANRALRCFEEAGDEEGSQAVIELIQATYNTAIQIYCQTNEPDQIYYTLSKDSPVEDPSKNIKEWRIPMPAFQRMEGLDKGDGFLHVFDPHPPPSL